MHHILRRLTDQLSIEIKGSHRSCDHIFPDVKFQQNRFVGIRDPGPGNITAGLQGIILVKGRRSGRDVLKVAIGLKNLRLGFWRYPGMVYDEGPVGVEAKKAFKSSFLSGSKEAGSW